MTFYVRLLGEEDDWSKINAVDEFAAAEEFARDYNCWQGARASLLAVEVSSDPGGDGAEPFTVTWRMEPVYSARRKPEVAP